VAVGADEEAAAVVAEPGEGAFDWERLVVTPRAEHVHGDAELDGAVFACRIAGKATNAMTTELR
jgi:hypothetical protein